MDNAGEKMKVVVSAVGEGAYELLRQRPDAEDLTEVELGVAAPCARVELNGTDARNLLREAHRLAVQCDGEWQVEAVKGDELTISDLMWAVAGNLFVDGEHVRPPAGQVRSAIYLPVLREVHVRRTGCPVRCVI